MGVELNRSGCVFLILTTATSDPTSWCTSNSSSKPAMGYTFHWYKKQKLVIVSFRDSAAGNELVEALAAVLVDKRWRPGFNQIWDMRFVESLTILTSDLGAIQLMVEQFNELNHPAHKLAVIASRQEIYHRCELLITGLKKWECQKKVFRTIRAGQSWLGITSLPPHSLY